MISRRSGCRTTLRGEPLEPRLALSTIVTDDNWAVADGGVKDLNTGLVWSSSARERTGSLWTYSGAQTQANNLVEGGYDDWRLPTQAELQEAASHGIGNHAYAQWVSGNPAPTVWSTAKCSPGGGGGHIQVSLFDGSTVCRVDQMGIDTVAVRGSHVSPTYSNPNIRVYSQLVYTKETGANGRFTVALDTQPSANVTIPVSQSDTSEGTVATTPLTFTPTTWNVPQGVLITSSDDTYFDPNASYQIVLGAASSADGAYAGMNPPDITVVNQEKYEYPVALQSSDLTVAENASDSGFLNFRLNGQPKTAGNVYVVVTSLDTTEGTVTNSVLTFDASNWNVPQTAIISGVADGVPDGDQTFSIQVSIRSDSLPEFVAAKSWPLMSFRCSDMDGVLTSHASGNVNLAIPDPGTVTSTLVVPPPTDGYDRIGDLNVQLNINHTWDGDITATLISPSGQRVKLLDRAGGSGDNFVNTTLDDEASGGIGGSAPFTGTFRPAESLAALDGALVGGNWKLEINDAVRKDKGTLVNWSLNFSRIPASAAASASANDEALLLLLMAEELSSSNQRK